MGLRFWWLSLLVLLLTVAFLLYGNRLKLNRWRKVPAEKRQPVSHTRRLRNLPEYQTILSKYGKFVLVGLTLLSLVWLSTAVLIGRPSISEVIYPEVRNRDIVLCFDVSGSMAQAIAKSLETFSDLARGFDGQRIGLSFFNSSSVTILPLTNDYYLATRTLDELAERIKADDYDSWNYIYAGTMEGSGSSLVADGLASCIQRFDQLKSKRSRSIILITDNYSGKNSLVTWDQAINLAKENSVRIYGINPADYSFEGSVYTYTSPEVKSFKQGTLDTGGDYYKLDDKLAVGSIIQKINDQDAALAQGSPELLVVDQPKLWLVVSLVLLVGYLVLVWRFRL